MLTLHFHVNEQACERRQNGENYRSYPLPGKTSDCHSPFSMLFLENARRKRPLTEGYGAEKNIRKNMTKIRRLPKGEFLYVSSGLITRDGKKRMYAISTNSRPRLRTSGDPRRIQLITCSFKSERRKMRPPQKLTMTQLARVTKYCIKVRYHASSSLPSAVDAIRTRSHGHYTPFRKLHHK
ncbi:hypothetical protein Tcan_01389, partial [Toxocara canis]